MSLESRCQQGLGFHPIARLEKDMLPSACGCWQESVPCSLSDREPEFLAGYWPEATLSSLPHGSL